MELNHHRKSIKTEPKMVPRAISRKNNFLTPKCPAEIGLLFRFGPIMKLFWLFVFVSFYMF